MTEGLRRFYKAQEGEALDHRRQRVILCGSEWDDGWNISGDCVPCLRNKCKYRILNSIGF